MNIRVISKKFPNPTDAPVYYVGRGNNSVLGNPFTHLEAHTRAQFTVKTVEEAVQRFLPWLREQYRLNSKVREALEALVDAALTHEKIYLQCWCAPQEGLSSTDPWICHGQVIASAIEKLAEKRVK